MIRFKNWFFVRVWLFLTAMVLIGFSPLPSAETGFAPIAVLSVGNPISPRVTLAAVTRVEIVAPSSVTLGETFEAMVENPVGFVVWTCDPGRLRRLDPNVEAKAEISNRYASQTKPLALDCCFQKPIPVSNCAAS